MPMHPTLDTLHTLGLHGLAKGFKEMAGHLLETLGQAMEAQSVQRVEGRMHQHDFFLFFTWPLAGGWDFSGSSRNPGCCRG